MALLQVWWSFTFIAAIIYSMEAVASLSSSNGNSQPLFFGLLGNQDNRLAKRGVEDALDDINNRSDILSGYNVKVLSTQTLLQSKVGYQQCHNIHEHVFITTVCIIPCMYTGRM